MRSHLKDLASNPELIPGIYNYCDRWCERCEFSSRCLLYATEQADPDANDPETRDITNEKFWRKLRDIFRDTAEMISEWAAEADIDLDSFDVTEEMAEQERATEKASRHEISQAATQYATAVETWFREEFATEENIFTDDRTSSVQFDVGVMEAVEVVRWYQFFIAVKLTRALGSAAEIDEQRRDDEFLFFDNFASEDDWDQNIDDDAVRARSSLIDANGSAKIALVAIDRSAAAWSALQLSLSEKIETIKPMLIELGHLRSSVEKKFPKARDFIRPGLDELSPGVIN